MVASFLPADRLNWTLLGGPLTYGPEGPIRRIWTRYPSVSLSPVTQAKLSPLPSVCRLTAGGYFIIVGRKTYMDLCPRSTRNRTSTVLGSSARQQHSEGQNRFDETPSVRTAEYSKYSPQYCKIVLILYWMRLKNVPK